LQAPELAYVEQFCMASRPGQVVDYFTRYPRFASAKSFARVLGGGGKESEFRSEARRWQRGKKKVKSGTSNKMTCKGGKEKPYLAGRPTITRISFSFLA